MPPVAGPRRRPLPQGVGGGSNGLQRRPQRADVGGVFETRPGVAPTSDELDGPLAGAVVARLGDLWLLATGTGLVVLDLGVGGPAVRHRRVVDVADRLRRELVELLTVAPFVESLVVVAGDATPGPAEVPVDLVGHLVTSDGADPVVARVRAVIDGGLLSLPWRRHRGSPVAG
jgi:hypothetical protein